MLETIGNRAVSTDCHVLDIDILLLVGLAERKNPEKAVFTFSVLLPERFAEICVAPSAPVDGILQSYIHIQSLSGSGCLRVLLLRQAVCFFLHASLVCFSVSVKIAQMGQSVNSVRTDRRVRRTNRLLFAQRVDSNESLPEGMEVRMRQLTENEAKGYNVARKGYCTRVGIF